MDRNYTVQIVVVIMHAVALRKESVDRNYTVQIVVVRMHAVALRKESVDRNWASLIKSSTDTPSLSARRAWIEIVGHRQRIIR